MGLKDKSFDRAAQEKWEEENLSFYACKSKKSKGRERKEILCPLRTEFQRDRDRITHSKSFRRLEHKTQVFIAPFGDHYRTRLTHTLEVSQVARTISRALRLNDDLTEAIALGHDLGHTPFGHIGEEALNEIYPRGFCHNQQSLRVVEKLEGKGGLNLTWEVRDGILNHSQEGEAILDSKSAYSPHTLEAEVVKLADPLAYVNHDIDDALRAGLIKRDDLPPGPVKILGETHGERISTLVEDIISSSWRKPHLEMSEDILKSFNDLRNFMYEKVYQCNVLLVEVKKARRLICNLYQFYLRNPQFFPDNFRENIKKEGIDRVAVDYIAGMTDWYALREYERYFFPQSWGYNGRIYSE